MDMQNVLDDNPFGNAECVGAAAGTGEAEPRGESELICEPCGNRLPHMLNEAIKALAETIAYHNITQLPYRNEVRAMCGGNRERRCSQTGRNSTG